MKRLSGERLSNLRSGVLRFERWWSGEALTLSERRSGDLNLSDLLSGEWLRRCMSGEGGLWRRGGGE